MSVWVIRKYYKLLLVIIFLVVVVLVLAAVLNVRRDDPSSRVDRSNALQVVKPLTPEQNNVGVSPDFFTEYRLERDKLRSEKAEVLREGIRGAATEDARQKGQDAVLRLMVDKQRENEMENLIKAKGFGDALVFIRDNTVSVVVRAQTLSRDEVIQVADIIGRVAGVKAEDITISAKP